ncbi:MAG: hypothetical protein WCJ02_03565 [bacterium]
MLSWRTIDTPSSGGNYDLVKLCQAKVEFTLPHYCDRSLSNPEYIVRQLPDFSCEQILTGIAHETIIR